MNIELTEELMVELVKLKMLKESSSFDDFALAIKVASKKLQLPENIILKILFSEEFLHRVVIKKTTIIDRQIKELEAEIIRQKGNKFAYGSLICNLYGHKPTRLEDDNHTCYCENCGRLVNMSSLQTEHERGLQNQKIYKEKISNESCKRR